MSSTQVSTSRYTDRVGNRIKKGDWVNVGQGNIGPYVVTKLHCNANRVPAVDLVPVDVPNLIPWTVALWQIEKVF